MPHNKFGYTFLPFSAGKRNCIGSGLAIIEAKIIIAKLFKTFGMKLKEGYELVMINKFMAEPLHPIEVDLKINP